MDDQDLPNVSNNLYAHVEEYDFSGEAGDLKQSFVSCNDIAIFQDGVMKLVKHVQVNKAQRPDDIKQFILISLGRKLDLFAYRVGRGVDAKLFTLNAFYKHMEKPKAHARLLFADFSSLLNTVNHTL